MEYYSLNHDWDCLFSPQYFQTHDYNFSPKITQDQLKMQQQTHPFAGPILLLKVPGKIIEKILNRRQLRQFTAMCSQQKDDTDRGTGTAPAMLHEPFATPELNKKSVDLFF